MSGPLAGVRVVDLTHYMAGPVCTLLLRDLGAEVIKVEPLDGEPGRLGAYPAPHGESLTFQVHNRGKMSTTVDVKKEEGKEVVRDLVRISDVFVENFRPGVIQRIGFGYEELRKINPTIVMASISGFGQTGPYSRWPAVDFIAQAMSGHMSLNGQPGDPPTKYGVEMGDYGGGVFGALSVSGALYRRAVSGQGEYIDISMLDAMVFQLNYHPIRYKYAGLLYGRIGNRVAGSGASGAYRCKDGHVAFAVGGDIRWKKLAQMIGRPELADDPRYVRSTQRWEHHDEIDAVIEEWTQQRSVSEVVEIAHQHDQIVGPVHSLPDLFADGHLRARNMFVEVEHPLGDRFTLPGTIFKMRNSHPPAVTSAAPLLGEHNGDVFCDLLGYTQEELHALEEAEIVHARTPGELPRE